MKKYKFLDHTADVMFEISGKNLKEIFENAALATFEVQVDLKKVKRKVKKKIKLKNSKSEDLLFDFIEELIYIKDTKSLVFNKFTVKIQEIKNSLSLECVAEGEKINPNKHNLKVDVKAITLHTFYLKKTSQGYKAQILLDI